MFGQRLEINIVQEMLDYDPKLRANYKLYQTLLRAMTNRDFNALVATLEKRNTKLISSYINTSLKTLRKHLPYIENSFNYIYNNGRIEGMSWMIGLSKKI